MKILIDTEKLELMLDDKIYEITPRLIVSYENDVSKGNIPPTYKLSNLSLNRLNGVHPRLADVIKTAITNSPYDFTIIQGLRNAKEQNELYKQGRSIKGKIVTNCDGYIKKSNHQAKSDSYGYAIDFGIYDRSKEDNIDWDSQSKYEAVARHIIEIGKEKGLKLEWGGDWINFKDYPHIELKGVI